MFVLAGALVLQVGLSRLWPECQRYVGILLLPVVWYGAAGTPRAAMFVGTAAGLLHDAWFEFPIGVYGFKWTLIAWALGALSSRIDLNHQGGLAMAGVLAWLADSLLDPGLRRLVDLEPIVRSPPEILVHAVTTGLLAALAGSIVERMQGRDSYRRLA
jgi:cell shape-determining protein MreD